MYIIRDMYKYIDTNRDIYKVLYIEIYKKDLYIKYI